jgi:hypothetical protein
VLGIVFSLDISIYRKEIVDPVYLHTMTGKEEKDHFMRFEFLAKRLELLVHLLR